MQTKLTIPSRIKVGYQKRSDTYTGNLAYVIYFDHKGVLRKETSWKSWCDTKLGSHDFDNVPTEGFVLNKKVGGTKESYGWNTRQEYVRVYDPRNFEFEISIPNLLFILRECNCSKGKGLEGEFVYAWDGTSLVLLPVSSSDCSPCAPGAGYLLNPCDDGVQSYCFGPDWFDKEQPCPYPVWKCGTDELIYTPAAE